MPKLNRNKKHFKNRSNKSREAIVFVDLPKQHRERKRNKAKGKFSGA